MAKYVNSTGTMYTWVRDCAAGNPLEPALEVQGERLSYEELTDLVDRLAGRLVEAVGRPPRAVGLLAARSLAAYAGYLAALRCGATVVPLNPRFPTARNQSMCRLAQVDVVLADDDGAAQVAAVAAPRGTATVVLPSRDTTPWWRGPVARAYDGPLLTDPEAVAYTLFTSGSTGEPKGVPIRHRNVAAYVAHCVDRYAAGPGARLSQTFELTFDPSVFDMFVAWASGATLVVPRPEEILTPARFAVAAGLTHWFSAPSVVSLARRLRLLRPACMPDLRWSLFCGEQLTLSQARAWAVAAPASVIENIYGPTELTVTCVGYRLPADPADWPQTSNATVPIGQGYSHLEVVLLDERGAATDDGELCVRGPQRFDGYVDPADDDGRFLRYEGGLARPHDGPPGPDSWYRTGDRVRVEGGEMVHLGRFDDQIKLHGYRIELGEVESALRRHPGVAEAVVLAVAAADGDADLHAFYTGQRLGDAEIARLMEDLPGYMRPRGYHHREALPLNLNGKTDRRALAAQFAAPPGAGS